MHDERGSARQLHQAQAPRQALAEKKIVAVMQDGDSQQLACSVLEGPLEINREAVLTGFARRVLDRSAVAALLQLEAPSAAAAGRPSAMRPRAPGGSVGSRVGSTGVLGLGPPS